MSSKQFCDVCSRSIVRNYVSQRLKLKRGEFTAEVMLMHGSTHNAGDICLPCLRELLDKGKEVK